ncbi:hybrid sensor histidine kinase/response regulator, partial [Allocoleopsis sp.]|uniref:hybrid sensor histidine kinase/response regulator n=1 Tax=Allocoleopsis sp. TaxID=3088169 RepID=UPI002FCF461B
YRRIVETANEGIWLIDPQARTTYVNSQMAQMLGYSVEQMLGRSYFEFIYESDRAAAKYRFEQRKQGFKDQSEFRLCCQDGSLIWVLSCTSPIFGDNGEFSGVLAMVTDVSDRKRAELEQKQLLEREQAARAQAETANQMKDEFLAILSHELRSPLNPILGWSKLLRSRKLDESTTARALETIERNALVQSELIEDLLDVSRIIRGKLSLNISSVNLASTIESAIETVRLAAEAKLIQLDLKIDSTIGMVKGDSNRLQQAIWNLLSNAVKFTPNGGRVEVRLEYNDTHAQIQVSDTGKGIHPDFLPYVFDYFRQENSTTTRQFGGLGLGLAIVRHLIELHGGSVKAASPGEGLGTTLTVTLPLMHLDALAPDKNSVLEDSPNLEGIRILVVDDEADTLELLVFILEQYGVEVRAVTSVAEVLEVLAQWQPDLLLSDIGMPEIDGYMLICQIRSLPPEQGGEIPAIALTAYAGETNQQQILQAGFTRHVTKPVEPAKLVVAIASLVGRTQLSPVHGCPLQKE